MIIWTGLILVLGFFMLFFPEKIVENDWIKQIGLAITLICIGIGVRMMGLRRKGTREKLQLRIKELEKEIELLKARVSPEISGKEPEEKA